LVAVLIEDFLFLCEGCCRHFSPELALPDSVMSFHHSVFVRTPAEFDGRGREEFFTS